MKIKLTELDRVSEQNGEHTAGQNTEDSRTVESAFMSIDAEKDAANPLIDLAKLNSKTSKFQIAKESLAKIDTRRSGAVKQAEKASELIQIQANDTEGSWRLNPHRVTDEDLFKTSSNSI